MAQEQLSATETTGTPGRQMCLCHDEQGDAVYLVQRSTVRKFNSQPLGGEAG